MPHPSEILSALLNSLWQSALLALAVYVMLSRMRGVNAATRYAIWWATLLVAVFLPVRYLPAPVQPKHFAAHVKAFPPTVEPKGLPGPAARKQYPMVAARVDLPTRVSREETGERAPFQLPAHEWPEIILTAWMLASFAMLIRLARSYRGLEGLKQRATRWEGAGFGIPSGRAGIRILSSREISTPLAAGLRRPAILLPEAFAESLSLGELRHIVLHETAHLTRYDDWTNLAQKLLEAIFCFHPVVHWIGRRLNVERELACDDHVVAATGEPGPYAACLARLVELAVCAPASALAAGVGGSRFQISRRIERLLDGTRDFTPSVSAANLVVSLLALATLVAVASSIPELIALPEQSFNSSGVTSLPGDRSAFHNSSFSWSDRFRRVDVRLNGSIEWTVDERDVRSVSSGGWFRLEETRGFVESRRYEVTAPSGAVRKAYFVNGKPMALDREGHAWLAGMLPEIIREMCVDVPARVHRIAARGGADGVLTEVALIHSDHCRRVYLETLIGRESLAPEQLRSAMRVARGINSDSDKASLVIAVAPACERAGLRAELFDAVATVNSDSDRRRALTALIGSDPHNRETLTLAAKSAGRMNSDSDKAAVLVQISERERQDETVRRAWLRAANSIHSDADRRRVLSAALAGDSSAGGFLLPVLRSAAAMNSDSDKRAVLLSAVNDYSERDSIRRAFFEALNSVNSDSDRRSVLSALLGRSSLAAATLIEISHSTARIQSDQDKASVLTAAAANLDDAAVRESFFAAAATISSSNDHARVLLAVLSRGRLAPSTVLEAIRSAGRIASDGDKGRVLTDAADRYGADPKVREEVRRALDTVQSDGEYRRVMKVLSRRGAS